MWRGPFQPARLNSQLGLASAAVVMLALAGKPASGAHVVPLLPLAALIGAYMGRRVHARWALMRERQVAALRHQWEDTTHKLRSDFLQQLTRELRAPVHSVIGIADLLQEEGLAADQRRHFNVFRRAAQTLSRLVDDVSDLARLESGTIKLAQTEFSLTTVLHDLLRRFRAEADAKGLHLELQISCEMPARVRGDLPRLKQLLACVLAHSVRSTRQGRVSVEVRTHSRQPDLIRFIVTDTSLGPVTGALAGMLQPFADHPSGQPRPVGVGLSVARRLAELMGGRLSVRHAAGKGTTTIFSALLPAAHTPPQPGSSMAGQSPSPARKPARANLPGPTPRGESEPPDTPQDTAAGPLASPAPGTTPATRDGRCISVLLVDDNICTRELLETFFDRARYRVVICSNGREALRAIAAAHYDVVLMDLNMPVMDGWAAVRALRAQEQARGQRPMPVIALGDVAFEMERQKCRDAGFDHHLSKPVSKKRLLNLVDELVRPPSNAPVKQPQPAPAAQSRLRADQRDALALLAKDNRVDVRTAVDSLGGDASIYLDAIEHLAPALSGWPARLSKALAQADVARARQMACDMQNILDVICATPCAAALGKLARALEASADTDHHAQAHRELEQQLLPLMATLQSVAERLRQGRMDRERQRQTGQNSPL
jgi:signal transduction histidine kinase/CheY-like chemotaxis protein